MRIQHFPYLPKDFIETTSGLIFAVVAYAPEPDGQVACFLRYIKQDGSWGKVSTMQANTLLAEKHPNYYHYADAIEAYYHAVPVADIVRHYQPKQALLTRLAAASETEHDIKLQQLISILEQYGADRLFLGLTGSMLIGQEQASSDIDLVVYGRENFRQARGSVQAALLAGVLAPLDEAAMRDNYNRRAGELDFDDFSWHDSRKYNKAMVAGTKFDIGMVCLPSEVAYDLSSYQKQTPRVFQTTIEDASQAFDYPARYQVADSDTPEVLVFTHSYVGQAEKGERVEISGVVERNAQGHSRLIVGSSREAAGEYIKVIR
jgi:predicted nucleotidyltransferase